MELINESAGKRSDLQTVNLKTGTDLQPSKIADEFKGIKDNYMSNLIDMLNLNNNDDIYFKLQNKLVTTCFYNVWDLIVPSNDQELIQKLSSQILNGTKLESAAHYLVDNIMSFVIDNNICDLDEKLMLHIKEFCCRCTTLAAKMASAKPNLEFLVPPIGSMVGDNNCDYFTSKPVVSLLRLPGIKGDDGTIFIKALVDVTLK